MMLSAKHAVVPSLKVSLLENTKFFHNHDRVYDSEDEPPTDVDNSGDSDDSQL